MNRESKPSAKRIIDVAHPGKSLPSATSKPVIVSNRPILKDPMMADEPVSEEQASQSEPTSITVKTKLQPLDKPAEKMSEPVTSDEQKTEKVDNKSEPTIAELAKTAKASRPEISEITEKPEEPENGTQEPTDEEKTPKDATELTSAEIDAAELEEQTKHDEAIEKLVESKEYMLPINAVEKRRTQRFIILGIVLSVLLIVAWVDIALDAGLIELGSIKPVTHFFSN